jgi:hypothetical protein
MANEPPHHRCGVSAQLEIKLGALGNKSKNGDLASGM